MRFKRPTVLVGLAIIISSTLSLLTSPSLAASDGLVEPSLKMSGGVADVALTFDACSGKVDRRILDALIGNNIKSTIFVTARWIKSNPTAFQHMLDRPDLFEIENHGREHHALVDYPTTVYGVPSVGSTAGVENEITAGNDAIERAGGKHTQWFRGATAKYDLSAMATAKKLGYRIAGFSINGDGGSLLTAKETEHRIAKAGNGDVVLAHINQPGHAAGQGVVNALLKMKAKGVNFIRLSDASPENGEPENGEPEYTKPVM